MADIVNLQAVPNQAITVTLGGQPCQIDVRQRRTGLFLDLHLAGSLIVAGAICQDRNPIVRSAHFGFVGDLMFYDALGSDDPVYTGIGTRFFLAYILPGDVL